MAYSKPIQQITQNPTRAADLCRRQPVRSLATNRRNRAHRPGSFTHIRLGRELRSLYHEHFDERRRERQLLSTCSFFLTFGAVRAITHAIRAERGPFRNLTLGADTFTT
ncbi:MAG TPA: hypothetical protein VID48_03900 [Solirubrobacteraceae bacterium]|jgi:hypothetical protein